MTFSLLNRETELAPDDIGRFNLQFAREIGRYIDCKNVRFIPLPQDRGAQAEMPPETRAGLNLLLDRMRPVVGTSGNGGVSLYLPFWSGDEIFAAAVLEGVDASYSRMTEDSLLERGRLVAKEFLRLKNWALDPVTGMFNGATFGEELKMMLERGGFLRGARDIEVSTASLSLLLLEVYPRARDAEQALSYIARAASCLDSLISRTYPLYHFGSGVFGLLLNGTAIDQAQRMADAMLNWLKRENFFKAHIGITQVSGATAGKGRVVDEDLPNQLLEQAWQSLRAARRRAPFAVCTYAAVKNINRHPLRPPPVRTVAGLRRLWRNDDLFSLVLLKDDGYEAGRDPALTETADASGPVFSKRALALIGRDVPVLPARVGEVYVYLADADEQQALGWSRNLQDRLSSLAGAAFSMGIACYPFHDFKKSDIPQNCRKALLHTAFLGPGTLTVFDAVSLNISGDIYYNEGDLRGALTEYRRGLALAPLNVNLLNSLGVTYAQMNRYKAAVPLFEKVIEAEPLNFMALFNLGFAYLARRDDNAALACFERALAIDAERYDLLIQLGRLYCQAGRYREAVDLLMKGLEMHAQGQKDVGHGAVDRYLGLSFKELGQARQAMTYLQRAVRHNPRDAASLSLLGELYSSENQGNDIALSLCRKAVDLDGRAEHWRRLGLVQFRTGDMPAAITSLRQAIRLDRKSVAAAFLLGRIYEGAGHLGRARIMYAKVLRLEPGHEGASAALRGISKKSGA